MWLPISLARVMFPAESLNRASYNCFEEIVYIIGEYNSEIYKVRFKRDSTHQIFYMEKRWITLNNEIIIKRKRPICKICCNPHIDKDCPKLSLRLF